MKYEKTKYPNILTYLTKSGIRYRIRKSYRVDGQKEIVDESGFKTIAHAKARLREVENKIDQSEHAYLQKKNTTVEEYYTLLANKKTMSHVWSKDSRYSNDSLFKNHIKPKYGSIQLNNLSRNDYELFINKKLQDLRYDSVKTIHNLFMSILNDAELEGILHRNRLKRVAIGKSNKPAKDKRVPLLEFREWMDMANLILDGYEMAAVQMCTYGLRRGEVCGLKKSIVTYSDHEEFATIEINDTRTVRELDGKGTTKNEPSLRFIVLDRKGTEAIQTLIAEATEIMADHNRILHGSDFLFLNPVTAKPFHPSQLNRIFNRVSASCGIYVTPHKLRHFFATQAAIAGVPSEQTAAYLGHKNATMTEHYTHIADETASNVVSIVSNHIKNA